MLALVSGQARHTGRHRRHGGQDHTVRDARARFSDVGNRRPSVKPVYTIVTANGKPAVLLNIYRQPDSNTVAVADEVHKEIEQIAASAACRRQHRAVLRPIRCWCSDSIKSVRDAILIGLVLAAIILVLFLRDWGTSIVAGLVIPATIAITFIALRAAGRKLQPDDARAVSRRRSDW